MAESNDQGTAGEAAGHPVRADAAAGAAIPSKQSQVLVATMPGTASHVRLALLTSLVFLTACVLSAPFAPSPLAQFPAVVALLQAVQVTVDLIVAALLFAQYSVQRSRAINILAAGYVFTALVVIAHTLTFPGVISQAGAFGTGPQSAAWLVAAWLLTRPLTVIAYALRRDGEIAAEHTHFRGMRDPILAVPLAATGGAVALMLLATLGHDRLPLLMDGEAFLTGTRVLTVVVLTITVIALVALFHRRSRSTLDTALMVVMFSWICAVILVAISEGRYSFGCLAARICSVLASSFLLAVLLYDTTTLYARMHGARAEGRARERRLKEIAATRVETERTVLAVVEKRAAEEADRMKSEFSARMSHELRTPLTCVLGLADRLAESGLTTEQRREVTLLRDAGESLLAMVDNLLGVSRTEVAKLASDRVSSSPTAAAAGAIGSRAHILVADDHPMIRRLIETMLTEVGHEVVLVQNGAEVITALEAINFDVVLMDVHMPEMDGLAATKRIREMGGRARNIPIIAVTAHATPGDVERCRAAGMTEHLSKPFNRDELLSLIGKWSGRDHAPTALPPDGT